MSARPCGVYVLVADLKNTVSNTPDIPKEFVDSILALLEKRWGNESVVDVILMAEQFWLWQYEITDEGKDRIKSFQFEAIMMRIKNDKLLPTVMTGGLKRGETSEFEAIGLEVKNTGSDTIIHQRNTSETKH